jgi:hypothetical protein
MKMISGINHQKELEQEVQQDMKVPENIKVLLIIQLWDQDWVNLEVTVEEEWLLTNIDSLVLIPLRNECLNF